MRISHSLFILPLVLLFSPNVQSEELPGGIRLRGQVNKTRVQPGEQIEIAVTVELPPGWIVYDLEQVPNSVLPTSLDLDSLADIAPLETFRSEGAHEERDSRFRNRLVRFFPFSPTFRRPLRVSPNAAPGERTISGKVGFLAQYLLTKRFYIVSRARFEATVLIDPPPAPATSDAEPVSTITEQPVEPAVSAALLAPPPPRPPVPPFHIVVHSPAPPRRHAEDGTIPWNALFLTSVILLTIGVATGILTPTWDLSFRRDWVDAMVR
ncbi:hypothetical protein K2X85_17475 [bacterium]|nr:hypothetical protein [bacterium]